MVKRTGFIQPLLFGAAVVGINIGSAFFAGDQPYNRLPLDRKIEEGFVKPSQLEIKLDDLDGDGMNETLLVYDGQRYLLRLDEEGKPVVQSYEITPIQYPR